IARCTTSECAAWKRASAARVAAGSALGARVTTTTSRPDRASRAAVSRSPAPPRSGGESRKRPGHALYRGLPTERRTVGARWWTRAGGRAQDGHMRRWLPLVVLAMVSCDGGEADPDAGSRVDAGSRADAGSRVDDAGVPEARCGALPLADVSAPDRVVGDGSAASCTEAALRDAAAAGGTIVFDCGDAPVTITV